MRKQLVIMMIFMFSLSVFGSVFKDVPREHWAFKSLKQLAEKGIIEGFADGTFKGNKNLSRYEAAKLVGRLAVMNSEKPLEKAIKQDLERLSREFARELSLLGVKVSALQEEITTLKGNVTQLQQSSPIAIHPKAKPGESWFGNIKLTGMLRQRFWNITHKNDTNLAPVANTKTGLGINVTRENNFENYTSLYNYFHAEIDEDIIGWGMFLTSGLWGANESFEHIPMNRMYAHSWNRTIQDTTPVLYYGYIDIKNIFERNIDVRMGRQALKLGHSIVYAAQTDGIFTTSKMDRFTLKTMLFDMNVRENLADDLWNNNNTNIALVNNATLGTSGLYHVMGKNEFGIPDGTTGHSQNKLPESGLSSYGISLDTKYKDHNIGLYYLTQNYDRYDPYSIMGDPYAVKWTSANVLTANATNGNANITPPSADPSWLGLTLNGDVSEKLSYYFEYVYYDPDVSAYKGNELLGAVNGEPTFTMLNGVAPFAIDFQKNEIEKGHMWMLGLDYDVNDEWNLLLQYGVGNEEFAPSIVKSNWRFNDMFGRFNVQASREMYMAWNPTGTFQGVKDLFAKLTWDANEKTKVHARYERCKENDTSKWRSIAGTDGFIYGVPVDGVRYMKPTDYTAIGAGFKHNITKNCNFILEYINLDYDQDNWWHDADNDGTRDAGEEYDINLSPNAGGWDIIRLITEVKF